MSRLAKIITFSFAVFVLLMGCGNSNDSATDNTNNSGTYMESTDEAANIDDETDIYANTIADETKVHADAFPDIDEQYSSWRGAHISELAEYAWVSVEPYVSEMDEYIEENDDVDWTLVEENCRFNESAIDAMADAGYNFVRVVLDTRFFFTDDEYFTNESTGQVFNGSADTYNADNWKKLDQVIEWCIERDIHVCFDVHSTPGGYMIGGDEEASREGLFSQTDLSDAELFLKFWQQAAERYSDVSYKALSFNLYNEPPHFITDRPDDYVNLMAEAVKEIRNVTPERIIFIDTLAYSTKGMDDFVALKQYDNIIYSFHYYSDYQWSENEMREGDWKSECDIRLSEYNEWANTNGVKWMMQEYGIQRDMHSLETRKAYLSYLTDKMKEYGVPYCYFAFTGGYGFELYDGTDIIEPEIVELTVE